MALGAEHLAYPQRRHGMDHDRYDWSMLGQRPPVAWPNGKKLALWVNVGLQFFPMNPGSPVRLPGSMSMPYPDLRHFTLRDYGNRVGIYRFLDAFDAHGVKPTLAVNAGLAERYPYLFEHMLARVRRACRGRAARPACRYSSIERVSMECGMLPLAYLRSNRSAPSVCTVAAILRATVSGEPA